MLIRDNSQIAALEMFSSVVNTADISWKERKERKKERKKSKWNTLLVLVSRYVFSSLRITY